MPSKNAQSVALHKNTDYAKARSPYDHAHGDALRTAGRAVRSGRGVGTVRVSGDYRTIQAAVDSANPGDEILVQEGAVGTSPDAHGCSSLEGSLHLEGVDVAGTPPS